MSLLCTVFIPHIFQNRLLVLGSIGSFILRIDIHSLVPLPKRSQPPEMIEDMRWNANYICHWSNVSKPFGQLLSCKLHSKVSVFCRLSLHLISSSHNAIHMIDHEIVLCDDVMQSDCMPFRHPQGPVSECDWNFNDVLDNGPFIMCCE